MGSYNLLISVGVSNKVKDAQLIIEDEGPGLPVGTEENIFQRFYQKRPKSEKFGTHSGLGLSISKQIVEAHGGRIWAENLIDVAGEIKGASFIILFPQS